MTTEGFWANVRRRRFTVDEVYRMTELGILHEDEPVELLDGELVIVSPQDPRHATCVLVLMERLAEAYRGIAHVRPQVPMEARPHSMPEPDLAVVRGQATDFALRHPSGREALLVVEIARTSKNIDRWKARIYAAAGVPVYWLVDLTTRRVEVFAAPSERGVFEQHQLLGSDDELELPVVGVRWSVADIVGRQS